MSCGRLSLVCGTCISVLQCVFTTCPTFGSHWAVTWSQNLLKSGIYIAKHFALMFIIFQVDRLSVSIRCFVFDKKKIPLLLNRSVKCDIVGENICISIFDKIPVIISLRLVLSSLTLQTKYTWHIFIFAQYSVVFIATFWSTNAYFWNVSVFCCGRVHCYTLCTLFYYNTVKSLI